MSEQKGKLPCENYGDHCLNVAALTKGESKKYRCILIDPPTPQPMIGKFKGRHSSSDKLHYKTMTIEQIKSLLLKNMQKKDAIYGYVAPTHF